MKQRTNFTPDIVYGDMKMTKEDLKKAKDKVNEILEDLNGR